MLTGSVKDPENFLCRAPVLNQDAQVELVKETEKLIEEIQRDAQALAESESENESENEAAFDNFLLNTASRWMDAMQAAINFYSKAYEAVSGQAVASVSEEIKYVRAAAQTNRELEAMLRNTKVSVQGMEKLSTEMALSARMLEKLYSEAAESLAQQGRAADAARAAAEKAIVETQGQIGLLRHKLLQTGKDISQAVTRMNNTPLAKLQALIAPAHQERLLRGVKANFSEYLTLLSLQQGKIAISFECTRSVQQTARGLMGMAAIDRLTPSLGKQSELVKGIRAVLGREGEALIKARMPEGKRITITMYTHIGPEEIEQIWKLSQDTRWRSKSPGTISKLTGRLFAGQMTLNLPEGVRVYSLSSLCAGWYQGGAQALLVKMYEDHAVAEKELSELKSGQEKLYAEEARLREKLSQNQEIVRESGQKQKLVQQASGSMELKIALTQERADALERQANDYKQRASSLDAKINQQQAYQESNQRSLERNERQLEQMEKRHIQITRTGRIAVGGAAAIVGIFTCYGMISSWNAYHEAAEISEDDIVYLEAATKLFGAAAAMVDAIVAVINDIVFPVARVAGGRALAGLAEYRLAQGALGGWKFTSKLISGRGFAIASFIVAGWDGKRAVNAWNDDDYGWAFLYGTAGIFGVIAGILFWTAAKRGPWPLAIILTGLGVLALVISKFEDTPAQDWLYHCHFGTAKTAGKWNVREAEKQFKRAFNIKDKPQTQAAAL
jgi:hypothetical protein